MADKYIDKIKYSDRYFLLDSGALHDSNHRLSGTNGNFETTGTIKAGTGIFNELIAVSLSAKNASIDELTAQNATVMGIMDVKGKLMTNSWEAASIANVGGSFYISPTGKDTGTPNVTITCNSITNGAGTYTITVGKGSGSNQGNGFGVSSTSSSLWSVGSRVLMTGNVICGTKNYPLGSLDGLVTARTISTNVITSITLNTITSSALDLIFTEQSTLAANSSITGTSNGSNMQISLYQSKSGNYFYPIGILLSSYGQSDKQQYIDIYSGSVKLGYQEDGTTTLNTGMAEPSLRIGQLDGLPNIVDGSTSTDTKPTGWGIYTTNGFFKGKIVSNAGKIAGWNISDTALFNGSTGINNTTTGAYLGCAASNTGLNVSGGSAATTITIANSNFTKTINGTSYSTLRVAIGSNFGMDSSGNIYANGANINSINAGNITAGDIAAARIQTNLITAINAKVSDISALTATLGGFQVDSTAIHTNGVAITSNADNSIALSSADFTRTINSTSRAGLRFAIGDKFGVTGDGIIYASSANISGNLTASSLKINGTEYIEQIPTISSKASGDAEYSVEISTGAIDFSANSGNGSYPMTATVYKLGVKQTSGSFTFKWYKDSGTTAVYTSTGYTSSYTATSSGLYTVTIE